MTKSLKLTGLFVLFVCAMHAQQINFPTSGLGTPVLIGSANTSVNQYFINGLKIPDSLIVDNFFALNGQIVLDGTRYDSSASGIVLNYSLQTTTFDLRFKNNTIRLGGLQNGVDGRWLLLGNLSTNGDSIVLINENLSSQAAGRFSLPLGIATYPLQSGYVALLRYSGFTHRWNVITTNFFSPTGGGVSLDGGQVAVGDGAANPLVGSNQLTYISGVFSAGVQTLGANGTGVRSTSTDAILGDIDQSNAYPVGFYYNSTTFSGSPPSGWNGIITEYFGDTYIGFDPNTGPTNAAIIVRNLISGGYEFNSPNWTINSVPYVYTNTQGNAGDVWTNDGLGNLSWQPGGGGSSLSLETNGTPNVDQALLNLAQSGSITITDNGAGTVTIGSAGGGGMSIIPITAAALKTLVNTYTADSTVIYQVSNAGAGQTGVHMKLNIMALTKGRLEVGGQGYFINSFMSDTVMVTATYDVQNNLVTSVYEPLGNNAVIAGTIGQSAIGMFPFDWFSFETDNKIDNTLMEDFDQSDVIAGNTYFISNNFKDSYFRADNHTSLTFEGNHVLGYNAGGSPDITFSFTGDNSDILYNDISPVSNITTGGILNIGAGAEINGCTIGRNSVVDIQSHTGCKLKSMRMGVASRVYFEANSIQVEGFSIDGERTSGTDIHLTASANKTFIFNSNIQNFGKTTNVLYTNSDIIASAAGTGVNLENAFVENTEIHNGDTGDSIRFANLNNCYVDFASFNNCVLRGTWANQIITFTADNQVKDNGKVDTIFGVASKDTVKYTIDGVSHQFPVGGGGGSIDTTITGCLNSLYVHTINACSPLAINASQIKLNDTTFFSIGATEIAGLSHDFGTTVFGAEAGGVYRNTNLKNSAFGRFTLGSNTTGHENTVLGWFAGGENTTGFNNTFAGSEAGSINTTGKSNTYIGRQSSDHNIDGSWNTATGCYSGNIGASLNYTSTYGYRSKAEFDNVLILGGNEPSFYTFTAGIGVYRFDRPAAQLHIKATHPGVPGLIVQDTAGTGIRDSLGFGKNKFDVRIDTIRIKNGEEATNKVLTVSADGYDHWKYPATIDSIACTSAQFIAAVAADTVIIGATYTITNPSAGASPSDQNVDYSFPISGQWNGVQLVNTRLYYYNIANVAIPVEYLWDLDFITLIKDNTFLVNPVEQSYPGFVVLTNTPNCVKWAIAALLNCYQVAYYETQNVTARQCEINVDSSNAQIINASLEIDSKLTLKDYKQRYSGIYGLNLGKVASLRLDSNTLGKYFDIGQYSDIKFGYHNQGEGGGEVSQFTAGMGCQFNSMPYNTFDEYITLHDAGKMFADTGSDFEGPIVIGEDDTLYVGKRCHFFSNIYIAPNDIEVIVPDNKIYTTSFEVYKTYSNVIDTLAVSAAPVYDISTINYATNISMFIGNIESISDITGARPHFKYRFDATSNVDPTSYVQFYSGGNLILKNGQDFFVGASDSSFIEFMSDEDGDTLYETNRYNYSPTPYCKDTLAATTAAVIYDFTFGGAGKHLISPYLTINSISTDIIKMTLEYDDQNGNHKTIDLYPAGVTSVNVSTATTPLYGAFQINVSAFGEIKLYTTLVNSLGSINYDAGVCVEPQF